VAGATHVILSTAKDLNVTPGFFAGMGLARHAPPTEGGAWCNETR
jgi:hypothetical protein